MAGRLKENETLYPEIERALSECTQGARTAEMRASRYLVLSQGESDDTVYEACRSMHRFYSTMHEYFLEEQRAIAALLKEHQPCPPPPQNVAA